MTNFSAVISRGLASARPAVGAVPVGSLYYSTDTGVVERNNGSTWDAFGGGFANPMTTQDDIIIGGASGLPTRLAKGSDGYVLTVDPSTHHLVWAAPSGGMTNPMTTADDIIVGGSSGTPTRVAKGSNNTVWGVNGSGVLGYKADPAGGGTLLLSENILGASAASVTVTLPSGHKELQLLFSGRGDAATQNVTVLSRVNGDTGGNYYWALGLGNAAPGSFGMGQGQADTSFVAGYIPAATGPTNQATGAKIDLLDYENTVFNKQIQSVFGLHNQTGTGGTWIGHANGYWHNTAALTSITFFLSSGNFIAGSVFRLYAR